MKKASYCICLSLFMLITFKNDGVTQAWRYNEAEVRMELSVLQDGTIQVSEERTLDITGFFDHLRLRIYGRPNNIDNLRVFMEGEELAPYEGEDDAPPETYKLQIERNLINIFARADAVSGKRAFRLEYTEAGVVEMADQFARLDMILYRGQTKFSANLNLPASDSDVYFWVSAMIDGHPAEVQTTSESVRIGPVQTGHFQEIGLKGVFPVPQGVAYPPSERAITGDIIVDLQHEARAHEAWIQQAYQQMEDDARLKERQSYWRPIALLMLLFSIYGIRKSAKRPRKWKKMQKEATGTLPAPPSDMPSSIVASLMSLHSGGTYIGAALLDLARKGYLHFTMEYRRIERFNRMRSGFLPYDLTVRVTGASDESILTEWEKFLLSFVKARQAQGHQSLKDIFPDTDKINLMWQVKFGGFRRRSLEGEELPKLTFMQMRRYMKLMRNFGRKFSRLFFKDIEKNLGLFRFNGSYLYLQGGALIVAIIAINTQLISGLFLFLTSVIGLLVAYLVRRNYTESGWKTKIEWEQYLRGLESKEVDDTLPLDTHLAYAAALDFWKFPDLSSYSRPTTFDIVGFLERYPKYKLEDITWLEIGETAGDLSTTEIYRNLTNLLYIEPRMSVKLYIKRDEKRIGGQLRRGKRGEV